MIIQNIHGVWCNIEMRLSGTFFSWVMIHWAVKKRKLECFQPWANLFWSTNSSLVPSWYIFFHRQESCLQRENFCFWILQGLDTGPFRPSTYYSQTGGLWGSQRYDHLSSEWFKLTFYCEWIFPCSEYWYEKRKKVSIQNGETRFHLSA